MLDTRLPNFDAETIRAFLVVVKCKNFGDASEVLHKTPAAVSYRIRTLEQQLGCPLFKRTHLTLELLPAGKKLEELFLQIYSLMENIPAQIHQINNSYVSDFSIGYGSSLTPSAIEKLSLFLSHQYPQTHFKFKEIAFSSDAQHCHCIIGGNDSLPANRHWSVKLLGKVEWVLLAKKACWDQRKILKICSVNVDHVEPIGKSTEYGFLVGAQHQTLPFEVLIKRFYQEDDIAVVLPKHMATQFFEEHLRSDYVQEPLGDSAFFFAHRMNFAQGLSQTILDFILSHPTDFGLNTALTEQ